MVSCGQEENIGGGYNYGFENYPPNIAASINSVPCQFGEGRFNIIYHTNAAMDGYGNPTLVQGTLTPGGLGGSPTSTYVGQGGSGDMVIVSKMSSSSSAVEVTFSLCRQSITMSGTQRIPFISEQRPPTIQLNGSIVVAPRTNCSTGAVSAAYTTVSIPSYPYSASYQCDEYKYCQDYYGRQYVCGTIPKTCTGQVAAPASGVSINYAPGPCQ